MNKLMPTVSLSLLGVLAACGSVTPPVPSSTLNSAAQPPAVQSSVPGPTAPSAPGTLEEQSRRSPPLPASAQVALSALMDEDGEYAALAAYTAVIERYGPLEPYVSIRESEVNHVAALIRQLGRLGVSVPANPYLGQIPAPANLQAAAQAWAEGEVLNVAMYDRLLAQVKADPQLTRVLTNLRRASLEVHLPLFTLAAQNGGVLTPEQLAAWRASR